MWENLHGAVEELPGLGQLLLVAGFSD